jgi:protocatechuate 3,4-dioxygenase, beta subunit
MLRDSTGKPLVIHFRDTSAGWNQPGQKLLITGIVYERDGETPAAGIEIYYYHTNISGRYIHDKNIAGSMVPNSKGQTHGYIRGWVRTDASGKYEIYTVRPGTYPTRDEPAHIHLTVREAARDKHYYIDDIVFDDDKLLTTAKRIKMDNRGGSGVVRLVQKKQLHLGERNIILGLNIPGYPSGDHQDSRSGRKAGEDVMSFTPFHAWGPDKGSTGGCCKRKRKNTESILRVW